MRSQKLYYIHSSIDSALPVAVEEAVSCWIQKWGAVVVELL